MNLKGKTNCAHGQQQEKDKCKNVVKKGCEGEKREGAGGVGNVP